jgi:protein TonB
LYKTTARNYRKEKKTPERLFIGLVIGLASSLCVLEYGEPLVSQFVFTGEISEHLDLFEEDVRVTLPEPEQEKIIQSDKINRQTVELNVVPDVIETKETSDPIDDFVFCDSGLYMPEFIPEPEIMDDIPFVLVEEKPTLDGLELFLARNVKYPPLRRDAGDQGYVAVQFTVTHSGAIDKDNIKILKSPHQDFTREVLRVMKKMPDWKPGMQRGKAVNVTYTLPIRFRLKS